MVLRKPQVEQIASTGHTGHQLIFGLAHVIGHPAEEPNTTDEVDMRLLNHNLQKSIQSSTTGRWSRALYPILISTACPLKPSLLVIPCCVPSDRTCVTAPPCRHHHHRPLLRAPIRLSSLGHLATQTQHKSLSSAHVHEHGTNDCSLERPSTLA